MKLLPLLVVAASSLAAGCASNGSHSHDHWNSASLSPRMGRAFLSYDEERDGEYSDFAAARRHDLGTLINRYFFNHNPDNPFQPEDEKPKD